MRQQQAFRPVPQENLSFVEQAGKPVPKNLIENGAISQMQPETLSNVSKLRHPNSLPTSLTQIIRVV
ncbi:hypothetical protein QUB16_26535 [Microcoleus sp. D3_18a_C4]